MRDFSPDLHPRDRLGKWRDAPARYLSAVERARAASGTADEPAARAELARATGAMAGRVGSLSPYLRPTHSPEDALFRANNAELLPADQRAALARYADSPSSLSDAERGSLLALVRSHRLPAPVRAERKAASGELDGLRPGDVVVEDRFRSASLGVSWGIGVGTEHGLLRVSMPAGTPAYYNPDSYGTESEVILPPGTRLRVTAVGELDGRPLVDAEVVPDAPASPGYPTHPAARSMRHLSPRKAELDRAQREVDRLSRELNRGSRGDRAKRDELQRARRRLDDIQSEVDREVSGALWRSSMGGPRSPGRPPTNPHTDVTRRRAWDAGYLDGSRGVPPATTSAAPGAQDAYDSGHLIARARAYGQPEWDDADRLAALYDAMQRAGDPESDRHDPARYASLKALHDALRAHLHPDAPASPGRPPIDRTLTRHQRVLAAQRGPKPPAVGDMNTAIRDAVRRVREHDWLQASPGRPGPPPFPQGGVSLVGHGHKMGPYGSWEQVADQLLRQRAQGHTDVRARAGLTRLRDLTGPEQAHLIALATQRAARK